MKAKNILITVAWLWAAVAWGQARQIVPRTGHGQFNPVAISTIHQPYFGKSLTPVNNSNYDPVHYSKSTATAAIHQLDSVVYKLPGSLQQWQNSDVETFEYDTLGRLVKSEHFMLQPGMRHPKGAQIFAYNSQGQEIQMDYYYWWNNSHAAWDRRNSVSSVYNSQGKLVSRKALVIDRSTSAILSAYKDTFAYAATGEVLHFISQQYVDSLVGWVNAYRISYTYNSGGRLSQSVSSGWEIGLQAWVHWDSATYTYDANGHLSSVLFYTKNTSNGTWYKHQKEDRLYDGAGNLLSSTWSNWDGQSAMWKWKYRENTAYDAFFNPISKSSFYWNNQLNIWMASDRICTVYDTNISAGQVVASTNWKGSSKILSIAYELWDDMNGQWQDAQRMVLHYTVFSGVGVQEDNLQPWAVYPNPATTVLKIDDLPSNETATISLYASDGRLIIHTTGTAYLELDVNTLPGGIYFLKIHVGDRLETRKVKID